MHGSSCSQHESGPASSSAADDSGAVHFRFVPDPALCSWNGSFTCEGIGQGCNPYGQNENLGVSTQYAHQSDAWCRIPEFLAWRSLGGFLSEFWSRASKRSAQRLPGNLSGTWHYRMCSLDVVSYFE